MSTLICDSYLIFSLEMCTSSFVLSSIYITALIWNCDTDHVKLLTFELHKIDADFLNTKSLVVQQHWMLFWFVML